MPLLLLAELIGLIQFVNEEDDLFDTLNDSLKRDDVGQTDLDDQFEFGTGSYSDGQLGVEDDVPKVRAYQFG